VDSPHLLAKKAIRFIHSSYVYAPPEYRRWCKTSTGQGVNASVTIWRCSQEPSVDFRTFIENA